MNQEAAVNQTIPETINWSEDDVAKALSFPKLREGWMEFVVQGAKTAVTKRGHLSIILTVAPVDLEGQAKSPSIRHQLTLPLTNPEVEGHTAPRTFGFVQSYLVATNPDTFGRFPKSVGNGIFLGVDGQEMDLDEYKIVKEAMTKKVLDEIKGRWANLNAFEGETFYGLVEANGDQGQYRNIGKLQGELPDGVEAITSDFADND